MPDVRHLLIVDGVVTESQMAPAGWIDPEGRSTIASPTGGIGWTYDGTALQAPVAPAPTVATLQAYAAKVRFAKQTGGITYGGTAITTDTYSRGMIADACSGLANAPDVETVNFKTPGGFVTLPRATMIAIGLAVFNFYQACFTAEMQVDAAIAAKTITTTSEIDAYGWPAASF